MILRRILLAAGAAIGSAVAAWAYRKWIRKEPELKQG